MHILLVGNGGREHALAWKLSQSPRVSKITAAPGNVGIEAEPKVATAAIPVTDFQALGAYAQANNVELTIVGPEVPLVGGLSDHFEKLGLKVLGPKAAAARLEGSKAYAKAFMQRHAIPTAQSETFTDIDKAHAYIKEKGAPIVIKADGLAAGKGVVVAQTLSEAHAAIDDMLDKAVFGDAGAKVVIEDFMQGEEASFIALVDGKNCLSFATSQDHKARDEGDTGPNTGGMGAYSPAPVVTGDANDHIMKDIIEPTVAGLIKDDTPFVGFLYVGLMIDQQGQARVVEYNVRLGDPETQALLMRLDTDLLELCESAVNGTLDQAKTQWKTGSAIGVVLAGGDYPAKSSHGEVIDGLDAVENEACKVFHSGTATENGKLVTQGGRVLCVTAIGTDISKAKALADAGAQTITFKNKYYRKDIGYRAVARLNH